MKHSETIGEVAKALSKAQGQFNPAMVSLASIS